MIQVYYFSYINSIEQGNGMIHVASCHVWNQQVGALYGDDLVVGLYNDRYVLPAQ